MMVASFGNLIPSHLIESFPMKGLNMHPSMLPQYISLLSILKFNRYRGAAPIYYTLLNGDKETGVSIIDLSKDKFDFGRIFKQVKVVRKQVSLSILRTSTLFGPSNLFQNNLQR